MAFVDTELAAKLEQDDLPSTKRPVNWYNVHDTVGPHRFTAYRKDDVLLVQLLLREATKADVRTEERHPEIPRFCPSEKLEVDGVFGKITKKWLDYYHQTRQGVVIYDVKVNRAKGSRPIAGKLYSIVYLNQEFFQENPFWHENLATDPRTPPELKAALQRPGPSNPYGDTFGRW